VLLVEVKKDGNDSRARVERHHGDPPVELRAAELSAVAPSSGCFAEVIVYLIGSSSGCRYARSAATAVSPSFRQFLCASSDT